MHSPLVSVLIPPYNVEKSEIESDFEIAYLNVAKMFYDKAPCNQYKTIREYRPLNPKRIASMQYHSLIRFRFACQLSDSSVLRYLGYFRIKSIPKVQKMAEQCK